MFRSATLGSGGLHQLHHHPAPFLPPPQRLSFAPPEDDEVFPHLWYDPEDYKHTAAGGDHRGYEPAHGDEGEEPEIEQPPSSTNSLLFEPLDLPPKSTGSTGSLSLEQTLKDAFLNFTPEPSPPTSLTSPLLLFDKSPPLSASSLMSAYLRSAASSMGGGSSNGGGSSRGAALFEHQTPIARHPELSGSHASVMNALLGFQPTTSPSSPWMAGSSSSSDPPTSAPHSMRQLLLSPSSLDSQGPLWISASMLATPTSQLPAPELGRKSPSRRPKARRVAKALASALSSPTTTPMVLSLAGLQGPVRTLASPTGRDSIGSYSPGGSAGSDSESALDKSAKGKKCVEPGCVRRAQSNSRCKAHGGGARCQFAGPGGCARSSQGGGFCRAHGGGKRCEFPGCERGQQRKGRCYVHGGIRKCQMGDCEKKDRGNGFCISHGGGKRCEHPGCSRAVRRGLLCQLHETAT
ncbi:hypothetical protein PybrP1_004395 [[Pythium] brassicae (nom. inval.)]|nr:hypothetical protein PybrP1_004395 [[Pythium] brassicae (nom. inval.)]